MKFMNPFMKVQALQKEREQKLGEALMLSYGKKRDANQLELGVGDRVEPVKAEGDGQSERPLAVALVIELLHQPI